MGILQYLLSTGVCTSGELVGLKKADPDGYNKLIDWAKESAKLNGVTIESKT